MPRPINLMLALSGILVVYLGYPLWLGILCVIPIVIPMDEEEKDEK